MKRCDHCYHWERDLYSDDIGVCNWFDWVEILPAWANDVIGDATSDLRETKDTDGTNCPMFQDIDAGINAELFDREMAKDD